MKNNLHKMFENEEFVALLKISILLRDACIIKSKDLLKEHLCIQCFLLISTGETSRLHVDNPASYFLVPSKHKPTACNDEAAGNTALRVPVGVTHSHHRFHRPLQ